MPHPDSFRTQQKIAKILSSVDSVIEKTEAAIAKYKAIKQGMLHDLFTRGIDSKTGKLRPKYEDAPERYKKSELGWIPKEWKINIFSEIAEIINGGTPSTDVEDYWGGNIPWLSVDDFNKGKRFVDVASKSITELGLKNSATYLLPVNATIISARGTVGVIAQLKIPMAFNQSCYGILSKIYTISNDFIYYYLLFHKSFRGFLSFGSVFNTITREYFDKFWIMFPADNKELELIVQRMSNADLQIENEINYLNKLIQLKKGLMADLLSGKKELKVNQTNERN